jgi:putative methyltransferase (TIGR04325 family)
MARRLVPPLAWEFARRATRPLRGSGEAFTYAPQGWGTRLPPGNGLDCAHFVARERRDFDLLVSGDLRGAPPARAKWALEQSHWLSYADTLALAARERQPIKILDYGGGLGCFYPIGKAALPGVAMDFHCRDLEAIVAEGRKVNPDVVWHTDDSCFDESFDLVILSAVLQYIPDWQGLLRRAARSTRHHCLVAGTPTVERVPGFVSVERVHGAVALYQALNRRELLETARAAGLIRLREFPAEKHPPILNAPEQPLECGWLFRRAEAG